MSDGNHRPEHGPPGQSRHDEPPGTSGQVGPKSNDSKYRQHSGQARPSERLRQDDDAPPGNDADSSGGSSHSGPSDKKAARDGRRFEKSKFRAEKTGAKLDTAKEKLARQKPPKKPGPVKYAAKKAGAGAWYYAHQKIHEVECENVGVEAAHRTELTGETAVRGTTRFVKHRVRTHPARSVRKWERRDIWAKADLQYRKLAQEHPELKDNAISRYFQKQRIKRQYQKKAREAAKKGAKAAEKTAVTTEKITRAAAGFVRQHPVGVLVFIGAFLLIVALHSCMASMTTIGNGLIGAVGASTYPSEDADMLAAEAAYSGMEADLKDELDNYESNHDYDEYHHDLDDIEHDPYVLISILSALHEGAWTLDEVQVDLAMLFERQYILTETVETERRYYIETDTWTETDPETGETTTYTDSYRVYYDYYICTVTLENFNLSHLPIYIMSEAQVSRYALYTATLGNRPDLFGGTVKTYTDYDIPEEYLEDETFAAIITEAEKYLGYPYVWGGYCPATSFDCSGFVSWVINHSGWNVGRLGAQGLYNICTPISAANVKPGDLVFFVGTYDTEGISHVAIYVGDGMMIQVGNPIGYANMTTSYWQSHFYSFGRLP